MTDFLSAGVYPVEVNYSPSVQAASTSVFGIVGVFSQGPIGVPTLVTSLTQAQQLFGTYLDAQGYYGMLALKAFFENGGGRAYVVRTVHYATGVAQGAAATVNLVDQNATPAQTLKVSALNPGTWGNAVSVTIGASVAYPSTGFNLTVLQAGIVVETWKDLLIGTANVASSDYVEKRINNSSFYIVVSDLVSATASPANRPALATTALASGNDGLAGLTVADFVGSSGTRNGLYALDPVAVNFVAVPGQAGAQGSAVDAAALATGLITYAEGRGDCVALIEAPQGTTVAGIAAFRNGASPWSTAFNSTYTAMFGPGVIETHPVTGRPVWVPGTAIAAGLIAGSDAKSAGPWMAAAGMTRGVVKGALSGEYLLSKGDRDTLSSIGVNPICTINGSLVLWGSNTMALASSKLSFLEVRRTMCFIESSIDSALVQLVFEPDNPKTMDAVIRLINPFLRGIVSAGGLLDFKVICDATLNTPAITTQGILKTRVLVKPVGASRFLPIEYAITADGTDFSEL